uniref:Tryptophan synthase alpha chain n=1 Tax=Gronococcus sybilensis TaxID=3028029 RepID=A0A9Y1I2K4_9RHOD|nr:tryptophan synthase alpha subunit [Gronococcus sybilensis]
MSTISEAFVKAKPRSALIPFLVAGSPTLTTTAKAIEQLDYIGVDIIEIGLPYSDPLADGPVIQKASLQAISQGVTIRSIFNMLENLTSFIKTPIVLFCYYNLIINYGLKNFIEKVQDIGIKGLLIPDLPMEESDLIYKYAAKTNIELILLVTPTSSYSRIYEIVQKSQGFIYLVSSTGVTGIRSQLGTETYNLLKKIKNITDKPIAIGFGISRKSHAYQIKSWGADGIIIGSACVDILTNNNSNDGPLHLSNFLSEIQKVT